MDRAVVVTAAVAMVVTAVSHARCIPLSVPVVVMRLRYLSSHAKIAPSIAAIASRTNAIATRAAEEPAGNL
ncbi:hypothetical protein KDH_30860 [Dictyobacter sp. S3.2.2.5]|uniref:Secreted protein n=1 Tax=Dictyobacter halimunensis TaxID=3026934 RepID=A0ABQ6FUY8_9CHLR|nr:hypothetical protein KDH_30860 [Dictyobacter sp. S3.2.2.5]